MKTIFAIARLTLKEGLKHRVVFGVFLASLFLMTGAVLISGFFMRDIVKVILDFCLSVINIGGLLVPFYLAISLLSGDMEQRTVVTILSRNISRNQYLLGKFLGICLLTAIVMALFSLASFIAVLGGKILYGGNYFKTFSTNSVLISVLLSYLGITVLNATVVLWCTITTTPFLSTLLTIATYFIGHSIDDVVRFVESPPPGIEISSSVLHTVQITQYIFPNLAAFDYKLVAAHGLSIPFAEMILLSGYASVYITFLLVLSIILFSRRDLC